jgi:eukaryotic-like serine/threonine-protein kinase
MMNLAKSPSVADLVAALQQTGILQAAQTMEVSEALQQQFKTPQELGTELRRRNWLTSYQIEQLILGKGEELSFGPYILLKPLGEGGMGKVFKARHKLMDRIVAIKFIREDLLALPNTVQRFYREVQAAAKLSHPNIVIAHDAAQVGDKHYLVTEYIEGIDLFSLLEQRGPLKPSAAALAMRQVAMGLQHAHEHGMVHRDIKPNNILLPFKGGQVKILDFGLARLQQITMPDGGVAGTITQQGTLMGTPDYLAPEQAIDFHQADIRSDIYSLGCTMYHLLAGRAPFHDVPTMQKLAKHQFSKPQPLEELVANMPPGLSAVIEKMMAKRAADRYQTPAQVAEALLPFTKGAVPPQPPNPNKESSFDQRMPTPHPSGAGSGRLSSPNASPTRHETDTLPGPIPSPVGRLSPPPMSPVTPGPRRSRTPDPLLQDLDDEPMPLPPAHVIPGWLWAVIGAMALLIVVLILWIILSK